MRSLLARVSLADGLGMLKRALAPTCCSQRSGARMRVSVFVGDQEHVVRTQDGTTFGRRQSRALAQSSSLGHLLTPGWRDPLISTHTQSRVVASRPDQPRHDGMDDMVLDRVL